jgi:hypothetical protein
VTEQTNGTAVEFPVRDLVRQVTDDLAPEESRVLAALDRFGDAEAMRRLTVRPGRDQRLGFGLDEAVALTSAIAWIGVDEAVRQIVDATADKAVHSRRRWWPFSRQRRPEPAAAVPALSAEQLKLVEHCVHEAAHAAGLSADRGGRIADGVIRQLVIGPEKTTKAASPEAP